MSIFKGNVLRNEPILLSGLVQTVLGLLLAFGVDLSDEQVGSIMAVTAILLAIGARMLVTPTTQTPPQALPQATNPEQPMYPTPPEQPPAGGV